MSESVTKKFVNSNEWPISQINLKVSIDSKVIKSIKGIKGNQVVSKGIKRYQEVSRVINLYQVYPEYLEVSIASNSSTEV